MKKIPPRTDTDYRIAYAQSFNLAVAMVAPLYGDTKNRLDTPEAKERIELWQAYFYKKLVDDCIEDDLEDNLKKLNSDRSDKVAKHRIDYIEDLDQQI